MLQRRRRLEQDLDLIGSLRKKRDDLSVLLEWADDDATRRRILVDNPAELYGF